MRRSGIADLPLHGGSILDGLSVPRSQGVRSTGENVGILVAFLQGPQLVLPAFRLILCDMQDRRPAPVWTEQYWDRR